MSFLLSDSLALTGACFQAQLAARERFLAAGLLVTWAGRAGPALASQNLKAEGSAECITGGNVWELKIRGSGNSAGGAEVAFHSIS